VAGHAGLRETEDAGQLGDVETFAAQDAQQAQARFVTEEAVQG
jgi:hypothetical protein